MLSALSLILAASPAARPEVVWTVERRGSFVMAMRPDQAPKIVAHVLGLVDRGFYDGLLVHRKVPGFVVQTGDPESRGVSAAWARANPGERGGTKGLGSGGSGAKVPFEINDLTHKRYTVGMALDGPMNDTGDSQWFVNLADNDRLNGMYVAFAEVTAGRDVLDRLERGDRITRARGR